MTVKMETSDWSEVSWRMMDDWRCVLKGDGELYLMMVGQPLMLKLCADNWDIAHKVNEIIVIGQIVGNKVGFFVGVISTNFSETTGQTLLNEVECDGTESRLLDCRYDSILFKDSHFRAISIQCQLCECGCRIS